VSEQTFDIEGALTKALKRGLVQLRRNDGAPLERRLSQQSQRVGVSIVPDDVVVELTTKGGAVWERKARPLWDYFVDEGEPQAVRGTAWIFLEAHNRAWLEAVNETLTSLGFFRSGERHLTRHRNWHPLYWKQLRWGYSLGINTGVPIDSERGQRFFQGLAAADERLSDSFAVLAAVWDAGWLCKLHRASMANGHG